MLVKEVMNTDVKTIEPGSTILDASVMMRDLSIGCLVVLGNSDRLAGILTDSDIINKVVSEDKTASKVKVSRIMSKKLVVIRENQDIEDAVEVMDKAKVKKLPVVSGSSLVGLLTVSDLAQAQPKLIKQISSLLVFPKNKKTMAG